MEIPDDLLCLFNSRVKEQNGSYTIEVPEHEITTGDIEPGQTYRVAVLSSATGSETEAVVEHDRRDRERGASGAPVEKGETVEVEIEDIGEQGDGIARIGPGYIVFVPDTDIGNRVTVEITQVRENFAFGDVIEGPY